MKLIICGNGFDLHHGFKTGYHHYKNFLEVHYPQAIRDFEDFPYINLSVSVSSIITMPFFSKSAANMPLPLIIFPENVPSYISL